MYIFWVLISFLESRDKFSCVHFGATYRIVKVDPPTFHHIHGCLVNRTLILLVLAEMPTWYWLLEISLSVPSWCSALMHVWCKKRETCFRKNLMRLLNLEYLLWFSTYLLSVSFHFNQNKLRHCFMFALSCKYFSHLIRGKFGSQFKDTLSNQSYKWTTFPLMIFIYVYDKTCWTNDYLYYKWKWWVGLCWKFVQGTQTEDRIVSRLTSKINCMSQQIVSFVCLFILRLSCDAVCKWHATSLTSTFLWVVSIC